mgnify:CR=1 FL=1
MAESIASAAQVVFVDAYAADQRDALHYLAGSLDLPLTRINNVAYERSLTDRMFGCGSLVFTTSAEAPVVLNDVPKVEEVGVAISNLLFGVRA